MVLKKCHFIGIGGIGMSGLAHLLMTENCLVSGSDLSPNDRIQALSASGAKIVFGHTESNIPEEASVVYTSMVTEKNPEFSFAKQNNIPLLHRSDLLKLLMQGSKPLLIAGSHGKTTTTSLLSWTLEHAGVDPTYAIGGVLLNSGTNARKGKGPYFVAEADESDGTFTKYQGYGAIVTNISHEHMDFYKEKSNLLNSFKTFFNNIEKEESLFWCAEDRDLSELKPKGLSYGFVTTADLRGENFCQEEGIICFDAHFQGKKYAHISLPMIGRHNALNALAVFGLCISLGVPEEKVRAAFLLFKGSGRRLEKKGESKGVLVIDDYAHHPNEIATTINTLRKSFPWRRIVVLYQPHRYSRTFHCKGTFGSIFNAADRTFITDIYAALEQPIEGVNTHSIIQEVHEAGNLACSYIKKENIVAEFVQHLQPLDVVVVLGAGDITSFCLPILKSIQEKLPPLKLGLLFGGASQEHEISLLSAQSVASGVDSGIFETHYFAIDRQGKWISGENAEKVISAKLKYVPDNQQDTAILPETLQELLLCDVVFPVMHGPNCEDGKMQGFLETLGIPHLNCSTKPSAICMDKAILKKIAHYHQLPILPFIDFSAFEWQNSKEDILRRISEELTYPLFVKPVHLGSTVGVMKVASEDSLEEGIAYALLYDNHIIVENGVQGREIEFAIFGDGPARVFAPGEILVSGGVYDFKNKYGDDAVSTDPAATLPQEAIARGMALAKKAYEIACCDGFARVDFFYDSEGNFFLNEINPIPGFTIHSLYPKICEKNDVSYFTLINYLATIGLSRMRKRKQWL